MIKLCSQRFFRRDASKNQCCWIVCLAWVELHLLCWRSQSKLPWAQRSKLMGVTTSTINEQWHSQFYGTSMQPHVSIWFSKGISEKIATTMFARMSDSGPPRQAYCKPVGLKHFMLTNNIQECIDMQLHTRAKLSLGCAGGVWARALTQGCSFHSVSE